MCMGDASTAKRCRQSNNAVASQILSDISFCYQRAFRGSCWHVAHVYNPLPHITPAKWNLTLLQRIPLHRPQSNVAAEFIKGWGIDTSSVSEAIMSDHGADDTVEYEHEVQNGRLCMTSGWRRLSS